MLVKILLPLILFFIIANPSTFKATRSLFGGWVSSPEGLPKQAGVLLHALVFVLVSKLIWRTFVRPSYYEDEKEKYEDEKETYEDEKEKYEDEKENYMTTPADY
jgi:hypothetical protein